MNGNVVGQKVGRLFKEYRLEAGFTQGEVSQHLKYSNSQFVSNFERGLCMLPLPKLRLALDLFKVSGAEIVDLIIELQKEHLENTLLKKPRKKKRKSPRRAAR